MLSDVMRLGQSSNTGKGNGRFVLRDRDALWPSHIQVVARISGIRSRFGFFQSHKLQLIQQRMSRK
jgi:hypothetical protein